MIGSKLRQTADRNRVKLPIEIASNCRLTIDKRRKEVIDYAQI